ncbi:MAG: MFS transporter [Thermoguttaceae bacterium]|jgi:MFS family permease
MSVPLHIYIRLSLVMFFEYAVWGAWAPVLAARLLGPLKMSGKQIGWIYTTLPLACIVSPLLAGQLADRYLNLEWILAGAHLIAAILMIVAVRQKTFGGLFGTMLGWSFCYAATMPLVNSVLFSSVSDVPTKSLVFIWAPVAWALVGYSLSGWRVLRKAESDGTDALILSAALGLVTVVCCLFLPATPPTSQKTLFDALGFLQAPDFLLFIVTSLCVAGTMQFYFLGSGQYMMDRGISGKVVPGAMAMAQAAQALATFFALGFALEKLGFKWTLVMGAGSWLLLYIIYTVKAPRGILVVAQVLHGLAYVMFIIVTQIYAESVAPRELLSSMQGLIFAATTGVGLFLGTQLAGFVMDRYSVNGKFQWPKIWAFPLVITLVGTLVLAMAFQGQGKVIEKPAETTSAAAAK